MPSRRNRRYRRLLRRREEIDTSNLPVIEHNWRIDEDTARRIGGMTIEGIAEPEQQENTWTQRDALEFDFMMSQKHDQHMGIKPEESLSINYFTRDEQIERYAKSISFLVKEEYNMNETDPNHIHKKMILSQRRLSIIDKAKEMFDEEMLKEILDKVNEYNNEKDRMTSYTYEKANELYRNALDDIPNDRQFRSLTPKNIMNHMREEFEKLYKAQCAMKNKMKDDPLLMNIMFSERNSLIVYFNYMKDFIAQEETKKSSNR